MRQKKRILSLVLSLCMVFTMTSMPVSATEMKEAEVSENGESQIMLYSTTHNYDMNGFCTDENCEHPYQPANEVSGTYEIANAGQLYWFAELVNKGTTDVEGSTVAQNRNANAKLTKNIVLNGGDLSTCDGTSENTYRAWTPIGNNTNRYTGTFDGAGHTVSGLYINNTEINQGLFDYVGDVDTGGAVKNVGVVNSYIKGGRSSGGIVGYNRGTITSCYNTGAVSASDNFASVGGVVGVNNTGTITSCYNTGTVSGGWSAFVGGVVGNNTGTITSCYNTGTVSASDEKANVGGVVGYNASDNTITSCYNTGEVSASGQNCNVGGVVGYNASDKIITSCYYQQANGLSGIGAGSGDVTAKTIAEFASGEVAYLLNGGTSEGELTWYQTLTSDALPVLDSAHGIVYKGSKYDENGILTGEIAYSNTKLSGYQPADLKDGVYQIANASNLYWFAEQVNSGSTTASATLTADIVLNESDLSTYNGTDANTYITWTPIGSNSNRYTGTFDGAGHTVSGLYINNTSDNQGLFGCVGTGGTVKSVGVVNSYIKGGDFIGVIVGDNEGTITSCYNTGTVNASDESANVGGISGYNTGTITSCYNTGTVSASGESANVGGAVGFNDNNATITSCYYQQAEGLSGIGTGSGDVTAKTIAEFASGEVAYLLNGSTSEGELTWYQTLTSDALPVLDSTHGIVYKSSKYDENGVLVEEIAYSNTKPSSYQPAKLKDDVYQIANASNLYWFAEQVNSGSTTASATLTADIVLNESDLSTYNGTDANTYITWTPIGSNSNRYTGTFDGAGHTVSGLYINNTESNQGLFGCVGTGGTVKSVGVVNSYIKGGDFIGGIVGANGSGTITSCYNTGRVTARNSTHVGGVVGANGSGTITSCYNTGTVSAGGMSNNFAFVGGVVGAVNFGGTITSCYNTGAVSAEGIGNNNTYVGSVAGFSSSDKIITSCYYQQAEGLSGIGTGGGDITAKTIAEFASGEVAYLLNGSTSEGTLTWYQAIDSDPFPVLLKTDNNMVYQVNVYKGNVATNGYSNTNKDIIIKIDVIENMLAYTAPTDLNYDGSAKEATVTAAEGITGLGTITVKYKASGESDYLQGTPTAIGTYDVYVSIAEGTNYLATTEDIKVGSFTIKAPNYQITVTAVTTDNASVNVDTTGLGEYEDGSSVTVTTKPVPGYNFIGWFEKSDPTSDYSGTPLGSNLTYVFAAEKNVDLVAVYKPLGKVSVNINGGSSFKINDSAYSSDNTQNYVLGSTIKVEVVNTTDFAYWANEYGMVLSRDAVYSFTVTGKMSVKAVYNTKVENKTTVIFESYYGQIMTRTQLGESDMESFNIPDGPTRYGYTFTGWSMDKTTISEEITKGTDTITVVPVYELKQETYSITVNNGTGTNTYNMNAVVTAVANAPESGKKFSHWKDADNNILSYSETYQFYATKEITITAVYVEDAEVVEAKGTTEIMDIVKDTANGKISFISMSTVPEGCKIQKAGVIATNVEAVGTSGDDFNDSTAAYVRGNAWDGNAYRYTWTKRVVTESETWYVRAYLVYIDTNGNTQTVYGTMVSTSLSK